MVLKGRLGLETARVPHTDRHGLLWLERGRLVVESGSLVFSTAGTDLLEMGVYSIPFQLISNILMGPGTVVSHDALRLLARHQTGLLAVGSKGVRLYAVSMPFGPDRSERARRHAGIWSDESKRVNVARAMYAIRFGGSLPPYVRDIETLRGIEGGRTKRTYENLSKKYGVKWRGRRYDRQQPERTSPVNLALNHSATAVYAAARIAVAVTGTIPQLGFVHEASGHAFALDIADLFRDSVTIPVAFRAARDHAKERGADLESLTRRMAGDTLHKDNVVASMIDRIDEVLDAADDRDHQEHAR